MNDDVVHRLVHLQEVPSNPQQVLFDLLFYRNAPADAGMNEEIVVLLKIQIELAKEPQMMGPHRVMQSRASFFKVFRWTADIGRLDLIGRQRSGAAMIYPRAPELGVPEKQQQGLFVIAFQRLHL